MSLASCMSRSIFTAHLLSEYHDIVSRYPVIWGVIMYARMVRGLQYCLFSLLLIIRFTLALLHITELRDLNTSESLDLSLPFPHIVHYD